jgi:hypothetical protein
LYPFRYVFSCTSFRSTKARGGEDEARGGEIKEINSLKLLAGRLITTEGKVIANTMNAEKYCHHNEKAISATNKPCC